MLRGELPTDIKAAIHRKTGRRMEGATLTPFVLEYALNNRDVFRFVYTDESEPGVLADPGKQGESPTVFQEKTLSRMNKGALLDICASRGIETEGDLECGDLVKLILDSQKGA